MQIDENTEKLPFICEWIIKEKTSVAQVLTDILAHAAKIDPKYAKLTKENCVLRKKTYKNPTKVLLDEQVFGDDIYYSESQVKFCLLFLLF